MANPKGTITVIIECSCTSSREGQNIVVNQLAEGKLILKCLRCNATKRLV